MGRRKETGIEAAPFDGQCEVFEVRVRAACGEQKVELLFDTLAKQKSMQVPENKGPEPILTGTNSEP